MTSQEFQTLKQLTRLKPDSVATLGAYLVLVTGLSQVQASERLGCTQSIISRAVRTLKDRRRIARQIA
jgi:DNA-binding MarR family transcriptional regulator